MTELEKIAYAKSFIDKLANGVNPIDDSTIPDSDIVNNVRLSRCFFYVSDILRQVIENGGITPAPIVKEKKPRKQPYALSPEQAEQFEYSDTPITATEISVTMSERLLNPADSLLSERSYSIILVRFSTVEKGL